MSSQDQFTLSLLTACVMQQHQMLKQQSIMLRDLLDQVDSLGVRFSDMDRDLSIKITLFDQSEPRKQATKTRYPVRKSAASRSYGGKKI